MSSTSTDDMSVRLSGVVSFKLFDPRSHLLSFV